MTRTTRIATFLLAALGTLLVAGCGGPNLFDRVGGFWGYGICGVIVVILDIIALVEIVGSTWTFGRKAVWSLVIIFFPVLGLILYWIFAREAA